MKISELLKRLSATLVSSGPDAETTEGYAGDFLSFVMGRAPSGCAWFTVMSNVNVAAVALLAEIGVTVLCEGVKPDAALVDRVKKEGLTLITTDLDVYHAILEFSRK